MIEFGIRLDPKDLAHFQGAMKRYTGYLAQESAMALKDTGELYYLILIGHIGEFRGNEYVFEDTYWPALSPKWLKEKMAQGWTEEIWEATGGVKSSIRVYGVQTVGREISIFVGLKNVASDILRRAMENEFGALGFRARGFGVTMYDIPARPLFEPAKREVLRSPYRQQILSAFKRAAKSAAGKF